MLEVLSGSKTHQLDSVAGKTGLDLVKTVPNSGSVVALKVDGKLHDIHQPVPGSAKKVEFLELTHPEALEVIRHSTAHILAQAVKALFPKVQVTIGPVIENGFFYDFSTKAGGFSEADLPAIEERMKEIIKARHPVRREEWASEKAIEFFKAQGEHYKCEIIRDLGATSVSVYWQGDFVDLCRGPHIPHTGMVPAVKLMSVAGAYWRGDEKNEMLARIYGTAFGSREALKDYLFQIEEAKKRDHRRLGVELELFSFHPEAPAAPFFHPNGAFIYSEIQRLLQELNRINGFQDVVSPLVMSENLWKTSGHYDNYKENMYFTKVDEFNFAVKPMNCPGHCLIYGNTRHSYRELPIRMAEFGRVHRHERSGVTAGLFRVRSFVQDDAHIYCTEDQIQSEIVRVLRMIDFVYKSFGFEYRVELSTRPEKRIGSDDIWDKAENALKRALEAEGYDYKLNPGDGAFYGPKIDCHLKDSIGRSHQCGTVQLDFSMPARFHLEYNGSDNAVHTPVMIHRAIVGSLERFLGILIEHFAGRFPLWLAPRQVALMVVADEAKDFGAELFQKLSSLGMRVVLDDSADKLAGKVKKYQGLKVPYMVVLGAREAQAKNLSLRTLDGQQRQEVSVEDFLQECQTQARPVPRALS